MNAWLKVASVVFLGTIYAMVLWLSTPDPSTMASLTGGGQLLAALAAAVVCAHVVRRTTGYQRWTWTWLALAAAAWAFGQALCTLEAALPFAVEDVSQVGFIGFPVAATIGLTVWLRGQPGQLGVPIRDLLDGLIIGGSLVTLAWVTTLSSVVEREAGMGGSLAVSLVYPIGDIGVATLVLIAFIRGRAADRTTLAILALGLISLALSDSVRVYYASLPGDPSSALVSIAAFLGFLLLAVAASTVSVDSSAQGRWQTRRPGHALRPSPLLLLLPYVPFLVAVGTLVLQVARGQGSPTDEIALGMTLLVLVLVRQFLAMLDNERLLSELLETRDLLKHQALHDNLTGLANRVLFGDRLDRALMQPGTHVTVMFCDLDDFKRVNDELGHEAGDRLLQTVADRLLDCVRATDTVARLGGDEFAILLEASSEETRVAQRIVAAVQEPLLLNGQEIHPSVSVGVSRHLGWVEPIVERRAGNARRGVPAPVSAAPDSGARETTARALLRRADAAMYIAKGQGKGRFVMTEDLT
ncbi:diguanylate cyclase domain-containing protein [Nocardioides sp.]|uniref:diguanylate cyclase domain-containing protein n=1 Tax=Nocardioides sp. TaxID=35761 RepID=UPI00356668FD